MRVFCRRCSLGKMTFVQAVTIDPNGS